MRFHGLLAGTFLALATAAPAQVPDLHAGFLTPPSEARPMMRWWWFGPSVEKGEIAREIGMMKAGGFGGFEVQPLYPLAMDDPAKGLRNLPFLSDDFTAALRHAGETARAQGMRIDVTIGTGWPFGGSHVPVGEAAARVKMVEIALPRGARDAALPGIGQGEAMLAAFVGDKGRPDALTRVPLGGGARIAVKPANTDRTLLLFMMTRTGQQVKRPSVGAEGFVIDHMSRPAIDRHLKVVGDGLLTAFAGAAPPYAMFSDSLEAYESNWTDDLPAEFRRRRGYDLVDRLSALFLERADSAGVKHDWAKTLTELVDERYLQPIEDWSKARGTKFRAQVYGIPPVTLSSNAVVALPEGEGAAWRGFTSTRWATSAAHLYDRPVVSSETWTWLHSPAFRATPLDMKAEADVHFLQGVTQLIGHGWPYSPPGTPEPGWAMYAAAVFNEHNPWWNVMPDVTRYLGRVSFMLRQGKPANDIAIYLPTEDVMSEMKPGRASINDAAGEHVTPELVEQVLDAGYGFDLIDTAAIDKLPRYKAIVLPQMTRIEPAALAAIQRFVTRGGAVIATGAMPTKGTGLTGAARSDRTVAAGARALARSKRAAVTPLAGLGAALTRLVVPSMKLATPTPALAYIRRSTDAGDVYFVANTGNRPMATRARFESRVGTAQWWDPMTGAVSDAGTGEIAVTLAPFESRMLVFGERASGPAPVAAGGSVLASLSDGWRVTFPGIERRVATGWSWTDDAATRNYSGVASYARDVTLRAGATGRRVTLDFGEGTPVAPSPRQRRIAINYDPPVREAAVVFVNDVRIGALWAPPYRLDVTAALKPGRNRVRVEVANTAINLLASKPPADYRLLNLRYGERFQAQDMDGLQPVPSGLFGQVRLLAE